MQDGSLVAIIFNCLLATLVRAQQARLRAAAQQQYRGAGLARSHHDLEACVFIAEESRMRADRHRSLNL
jgi:hypothetical protein